MEKVKHTYFIVNKVSKSNSFKSPIFKEWLMEWKKVLNEVTRKQQVPIIQRHSFREGTCASRHVPRVPHHGGNQEAKRYQWLPWVGDTDSQMFIFFDILFHAYCVSYDKSVLRLSQERAALTLWARLRRAECFWCTEEGSSAERGLAGGAEHPGTSPPSPSKYLSWTEGMT